MNENKKETFISNYEITKKRVQKEFIQYDHAKMIEKFSLENDATYLYINFLKRKYRIHRTKGNVEWIKLPENGDLKEAEALKTEAWENAQEAGFNEVLTIFDVLCDSKEECTAAGKFKNMQSLSSIKGSTGRVGGNYYQAEAKWLDGRTKQLAKACERLGGKKNGKGDVSYEIPIFDFLSFRIQFWESDDEFEAGLEIFVDEHILQFMRYETMWYAVSHMLERIKEEMGTLKSS